MTDIYDRGRALAVRQLQPRPAGKGAALTLTHTSGGARDPATGTTTGATTNTYDTSGMRSRMGTRDADGELVLLTDTKFIVNPELTAGGNTPQPAPGWLLVFDGGTFRVIKVDVWNYAGLNCGYVVYGRNE